MEKDFNPLMHIVGLPAFSAVKPEHIKPAVESAVENCKNVIINVVEKNKDNPTWDNLMAPIEEADDRFSKIWSVVSHLNSVNNTQELRTAHDECLPLIAQYSTWAGQYRPLFDALTKIAKSDEFNLLTKAQRKSVENSLRDFRLSGIDLPEDKQRRFGEISARLSQLQSDFANNLLDATNNYVKNVIDEKELVGLPRGALNLAKSEAKKRSLDGYVFTLDIPSYLPVLTYADNRELRKEMYIAYNTRASDVGPDAGKWDNLPVMEEILSLRHELARLLDFKDYASLSLATKMAQNNDEVLSFLYDLANKSHNQGLEENRGMSLIIPKSCVRKNIPIMPKSCVRISLLIRLSPVFLSAQNAFTPLHSERVLVLMSGMKMSSVMTYTMSSAAKSVLYSWICMPVRENAAAPGWMSA